MNRFGAGLLAAVVVLTGAVSHMFGVSSVADAQALTAGTRAPELGLTDLQGRPVRLADLRGKVVVVDFWASWCAPCRDSFPFWNRMQAQYGGQGLVVVAVSVDRDAANVRSFIARNSASFRVAHDPNHAVADRYRPATMPSTFFIDRRGVVRQVHAGFRSRDKEGLESQIRTLLAATAN